ncbi:MAG: 50S ribosomal protein L20 [Chloroflexi bacterium]|nr:50S ribosomal protein L20 [Chloroflexota bacterium]MBI5350885.1 50S ribosomal protein L20 [Chloroflexota bacterium]MBI5712015.1 50S ribosomal protein L20 [Chloroflexota bacterium]
MARVKGGVVSRRRRNKVLKANEGYYGSRHLLWKKAHEAWLHAGQYAFEHRRKRKRDMRKLWIARINAAARLNGLSYSRLIAGMEKANINLDRKTLANLAATDAAAFAKVAEAVKTA